MTDDEGEQRTSDRVDLKHDKKVIQQLEEVRDRRKYLDKVEKQEMYTSVRMYNMWGLYQVESS